MNQSIAGIKGSYMGIHETVILDELIYPDEEEEMEGDGHNDLGSINQTTVMHNNPINEDSLPDELEEEMNG